MKWNDILSSPGKYSPNIIEFNRACGKNEHGTTIILRSIQRITDFNAQSLADNLSKIFITDSEFNIYVKHNDDDAIKIENERKYASLTKDVERHVPVDIKLQSEYAKSKDIKGHLIATKTPISPSTKMRGITLFSRRKMINLPEYFSESTSSHFFSYLTGWLEVDFIDDIEEDVIGTNRQSVNREHPDMKVLREYLQQMIRWLEGDRRKKRKEIRVKEVDSKGGVDIKKWRENIPEKIDTHIKQILDTILYDSEASEEQIATVIQNLYAMIPEHPYFHRRYLHPVLKDAAKEKYLKKDYYGAVEQ